MAQYCQSDTAQTNRFRWLRGTQGTETRAKLPNSENLLLTLSCAAEASGLQAVEGFSMNVAAAAAILQSLKDNSVY